MNPITPIESKQNLLDEDAPPEAILEAAVIVLRSYSGLFDVLDSETPTSEMSEMERNGIWLLYAELGELKKREDTARSYHASMTA